MSNPFNKLTDFNHSQVRKYLNFFRNKRQSSLRALSSEFSDLKHDRFGDSMYSKEDVEEALDFLQSAVNNHISHDMGLIINMGALTLSQLLENAQDKGIDLELEVSEAENQVLLDSIEKLSLESIPKTMRRGIDALPSFKEETRNLKAEAGRLEDSNRTLQERFSTLQSEYSKVMKKNSNLQEEVEALKNKSHSRAESKGDSDEINDLKREIMRLKEENEKRFQNSDQYLRMKNMMLSKSEKIRDLKRRLERYEPDAAKDEDD